MKNNLNYELEFLFGRWYEVSKYLGVSKQRVNQLEIKALNKIRNSEYFYELSLLDDNSDNILKKM